MEVEFDVKITVGALYDYMLSHAYKQAVSILATCVGTVMIYFFITTGKWFYLIGAILLIFYTPVSLLRRAFIQAKMVETFKKPLHYRLCDEGIEVSQEESKEIIPWENCLQACSTKISILVYTSKRSAFIFPRKELGEKCADVICSISNHLSPDKVKIRG